VSEGALDLVGLSDIIAEELNVSAINCVDLDDSAIERFGIGQKLIPNSRALGPRVGVPFKASVARSKKRGNGEENKVSSPWEKPSSRRANTAWSSPQPVKRQR